MDGKEMIRDAFIDFRMQRWEKEKLANMENEEETNQIKGV